MKCASAKATDKTGTSAADTGASAADTGTSAADTGTSAATAAGMCSAATATTAASAAMTAATSTAAATGQFYLLGERGLSGVFLVECVKCRQAGVEDFLLAEKQFMRL
jgi:hypothetical protein